MATSKKSSNRQKRGSKAPSEPVTIVQASAAQVEDGGSSKWMPTFAGIALAVVIGYFAFSGHKGGSGAASSAPSGPKGPQLTLQLISKFKINEGLIHHGKVDAQGDVYLVTDDGLALYQAGKESGTISVDHGSPLRCLAFDGRNFYLSESQSPGLHIIAKDFSSRHLIKVAGPAGIEAVLYNPKSGLLYVSDVTQSKIYTYNPRNGESGIFSSDVAWIADLEASADGTIFAEDGVRDQIYAFPLKGKSWSMPGPWSTPSWEHLAVLGDKIYINGTVDKCIYVMSQSGENYGYCSKLSDGTTFNAPHMIIAGQDNFVYMLDGNMMYKIAPYTPAAPKAETATTKS